MKFIFYRIYEENSDDSFGYCNGSLCIQNSIEKKVPIAVTEGQTILKYDGETYRPPRIFCPYFKEYPDMHIKIMFVGFRDKILGTCTNCNSNKIQCRPNID